MPAACMPAGTMPAVTGSVPDGDLAVVAELQGMLIEILEKRNAELTAQVTDLSERLARLERAVSRNSGNSGMPPSADDLPGKTAAGAEAEARRREEEAGQAARRSRRAPGLEREPGQAGSRCSRRAPARAGGTSRTRTTSGSSRRTSSWTRPAVTAVLTQYDGHAVACRCGRVHAAAPPAGAGEAGTVTYGPNLQAWCVFLLVMHHVPVERCAGIIEALTGTRPSDGFVHAHDRPRREGGPRGEHADPRPGHHRVACCAPTRPRSGSAPGRRPARSTCSWPARAC